MCLIDVALIKVSFSLLTSDFPLLSCPHTHTQDSRDTEIKNLPSLESMVAAIPQVSIDKDDDLTADFKAEKISAETVGVVV